MLVTNKISVRFINNKTKTLNYTDCYDFNTICDCCGAEFRNHSTMSSFLDGAGKGITAAIFKNDAVPPFMENVDFWVEEIPIDNDFKMLIKHRKHDPDYVNEEENDND